MRRKATNILILNPTTKFISFIQSKLPNLNWTKLDNIQFDPTAYVLHDIKNDDDLLAEVESLYQQIFEIEIKKILGQKFTKKINGSFFDFLSCFKFKVLLPELPMLSDN